MSKRETSDNRAALKAAYHDGRANGAAAACDDTLFRPPRPVRDKSRYYSERIVASPTAMASAAAPYVGSRTHWAGSRWGPVAGAMVYLYPQQYLVRIAAEPSFSALPAPLRVCRHSSASPPSTRCYTG